MRVADVVGAALRAAGVAAVHGPALPGVDVGSGLVVDDVELASLLALADEHVHGAPAAVHEGGQVLRFGRGSAAERLEVTRPGDVADAIREAADRRDRRPRDAVVVELAVDLAAPSGVAAAPLPRAASPWVPVDEEVVAALASAESLLFLVGPGVLRHRAEDGLRSLAAVTSVGVLNTWGAKGVFFWQSRHHLATIGLQAEDYLRSGLDDAALVVTSGLDPLESPPERWSLGAATVDVPPRMLAPLAESDGVGRPRREIRVPPIRTRLGAATAAGWEADGPRPAPSALTRRYSQLVGPAGLVAADPGMAGFFVARTLPTEAPRTVSVPAEADVEGFAIAACIAAWRRTPGRRCLAVVEGPPGARTSDLLSLAASARVPVVAEVWSGDGQDVPIDAHLAGTAAALAAAEPWPTLCPVAVDLTQLDAFLEAAGSIVAWTGL